MLMLAQLDQAASKSSLPSKNARHTYDKILKKVRSNDLYTMLSLGNDRLVNARMTDNDPKNRDMKQGLYKEACKWFDRCLKDNPTCIWAAQGMAIALAETNNLEEASVAFTSVREGLIGMKTESSHQLSALDMLNINAAHLMVEQGQCSMAIALYE